MSQLPTDCLNEILEYLKDDIVTLHSCLLVNRLWCEISVRILWRSNQKYKSWSYSTLIACLPNESKEILCENGIIISTPTKFPIFNYASFCKVLSINRVYYGIERLFKKQQQNLSNKTHIVLVQEVWKMFMN